MQQETEADGTPYVTVGRATRMRQKTWRSHRRRRGTAENTPGGHAIAAAGADTVHGTPVGIMLNSPANACWLNV